MKMQMILVATAAALTGCAHGSVQPAAAPLQVTARTAQPAPAPSPAAPAPSHLLVAGPAMVLHGNLDRSRPAALFLVEALRGDEGDCAVTPVAENLVPADAPALIAVPAGWELCAAPTGSNARASAPQRPAQPPVALK